MTDHRTLILEAGEKHSLVEAAKLGVEAAKAQLEAAKGALEAAKGDFDATLQKCEEAGLVKAKVKRAAEMIGTAFAEAGVSASAPEAQPAAVNEAAAQPAARKPKRRKAEDEAVHQPAAAQAQDFSAEAAEVRAAIDDILPAGLGQRQEAARLLLNAIVDALAVRSAGDGAPLDIETYRDALGSAEALALAEVPGVAAATAAAIRDGLASEDGAEAVSWARAAFIQMEDSPADPVPALFADRTAPSAPASEANEAPAVATPAAANGVTEAPSFEDDAAPFEPEAADLSGTDDMAEEAPGEAEAYPDFDEDAVSGDEEDATLHDDDETFPIGGGMPADQGEVLEDIGGINFLDEPEAPAPSPEPAAPAAPAEAPAAPEAPKPPKLGRPAFMKR